MAKHKKIKEEQVPKVAANAMTKEQALESRKLTVLSSFHDDDDEKGWVLFYTKKEDTTYLAGYHKSDGTHKEEKFSHEIESNKYFNDIRHTWITESLLRSPQKQEKERQKLNTSAFFNAKTWG